MRNYYLFLFFKVFLTLSYAQMTIELSHSEAASYLHFLNCGFDEPHTSGAMKQLIKNSKTNLFNDEILKNEFKNLKSFTENGYNLNDSSSRRSEGFYTESAITVLAVNSLDLKSFEKNISAFMPYRGVNNYFKLKEKFYPLFLQLVWKPTLANQKKEINLTNNILKKTKFLELLQKAKKFYGSDYPDSLAFKVGLVPIPNINLTSTHTSAENLRDVQVVPYLTNFGLKDNLGVIFHEFCHALYEAQPVKIQKEIDEYYLKQNDPYSLFVYRYLNETLATALGNGWYREILDGKIRTTSWYNINYVDGLARAYLPLIKSYMEESKTLDKNFMDKTLELAKVAFPNGPREIDANFMALNVVMDIEKLNQKNLKSILTSTFRIQSYENNELEIEKWIETPDNYLLITTNEKPGLKIMESFNNISDIKTSIKSLDNFWVSIPYKNRYFIWINIEDELFYIKALESIKSKSVFSDKPDITGL